MVKTKFGYHIIKLEDKRDKPLPSYDKIKSSLYSILVQKRVEELSSNLRKDAKIELFVEQEVLDNKSDSQNTDANAFN